MALAETNDNVWRQAGRLAGVGIAKMLFRDSPGAEMILGALGENLGPTVVKEVVPAVRGLIKQYGPPTAYDILRTAWGMAQSGEVTVDRFRRLLPRAVRQSVKVEPARQRRELPQNETFELECPVSGDTITHDLGPGTFECPDCKMDITVEHGAAEHQTVLSVECPESGEEIPVSSEEGAYECSDCGFEIWVEDGEAEHELVPEVECPTSHETITLEKGDGTYECPDCGEEIDVDDGHAEHAALSSAPVARRRSRSRK